MENSLIDYLPNELNLLICSFVKPKNISKLHISEYWCSIAGDDNYWYYLITLHFPFLIETKIIQLFSKEMNINNLKEIFIDLCMIEYYNKSLCNKQLRTKIIPIYVKSIVECDCKNILKRYIHIHMKSKDKILKSLIYIILEQNTTKWIDFMLLLIYDIDYNISIGEYLLKMSIINANLQILEYLCKRNCITNDNQSKILEYTIMYDSFDCFEYIINSSNVTNTNCIQKLVQCAAEYGLLRYIEFLYKKFKETCLSSRAIQSAAAGGHLDCLVYLHENGCPVYRSASSSAAQNGHLECIKFLHKKMHSISFDGVETACVGGHFDCLEYIYNNYADYDECTDEQKLMLSEYACRGGSLDCLKFIHINGFPLTTKAVERASEFGHLDCLKYLNENGCRFSQKAVKLILEKGHLDCLKYIYNLNCSVYILKVPHYWIHKNCDEFVNNIKKILKRSN